MVYPSRAESEWKSRHLMVIIMVVVFRPGWRIKYRKATGGGMRCKIHAKKSKHYKMKKFLIFGKKNYVSRILFF